MRIGPFLLLLLPPLPFSLARARVFHEPFATGRLSQTKPTTTLLLNDSRSCVDVVQ